MTDPAQLWRQLVLDIAHALRIDVVALWLARQRLTIWLNEHMPTLPWTWWRVWVWCAYAYTALILVWFAAMLLTGRLP
jgi:hypothetical protein